MASRIEHAEYDAPEITNARPSGAAIFNVLTPIIAALLALVLSVLIGARAQ